MVSKFIRVNGISAVAGLNLLSVYHILTQLYTLFYIPDILLRVVDVC